METMLYYALLRFGLSPMTEPSKLYSELKLTQASTVHHRS